MPTEITIAQWMQMSEEERERVRSEPGDLDDKAFVLEMIADPDIAVALEDDRPPLETWEMDQAYDELLDPQRQKAHLS
jgi:hypothetical protein